MKRLLVLASLVTACHTASVTDKSSVETPPDQPSEVDLPWDPAVAVDVQSLVTQEYFVIDESASVCPTVEEARANSCGNSVEFAEVGYIRRFGETVTVVGSGPIDGFWQAIRYTKAGTLPSWVDADRVAPEPDLTHVDVFVAAHPNALKIAADAIELAGKNSEFGGDSVPLEPAVFLAEIGGERVALQTDRCFVKAGTADTMYMLFHTCLLYGDCIDDGYLCGDDEYCDLIVVATEPAGEFTHDGTTYRALSVIKLADRMGVFERKDTCGF